MKTTTYRSLDKLTPSFREKVTNFLKGVNNGMDVIFVTESWRSEERQKELLKAGLSRVTRSNHQDGLAIDIGFYWPELYPSDMRKWRQVADVAKKCGIDWGFDLWSWDKPHFQDNWRPILPPISPIMKSRFSDIMSQELKAANLKPLFNTHEWQAPLTEQETRELIEIALVRAMKRK